MSGWRIGQLNGDLLSLKYTVYMPDRQREFKVMNFDPTALFFSIVAGMIGVGYCSFGKKQQNICFVIAGIGLMFYPYFIENVMALAGVGIALIIAPFVINRNQ